MNEEASTRYVDWEYRIIADSRNLQDAAPPGLSVDGKSSMAYNAARTLATVAVRAAGYRIKQTGGGHYSKRSCCIGHPTYLQHYRKCSPHP